MEEGMPECQNAHISITLCIFYYNSIIKGSVLTVAFISTDLEY